MKKKYWIGSLLSISVIVGAVMMVQPSLALFTSQDSETNKFKTGNLEIEIGENFQCELDSKTQKRICTKEVIIENTRSDIDAFIRVAIIPYWQDDDENYLPEDVSEVTLHFGDENENLVSVSPNEQPGWVNSADLNNDGEDDGTGDGYYYYNRLVEAGQSTTQLLSKVTVPEELFVSGKNLIVDVKAEAVQPSMDAIKDVWPELWIRDGFNEIGRMLARLLNPTTTTIEE